GLIGGPLIFVSSTAVLFGTYEQTSAWAFLVSLPEIAREASLGIGGSRPRPADVLIAGHAIRPSRRAERLVHRRICHLRTEPRSVFWGRGGPLALCAFWSVCCWVLV